jgi:hypothetical protein
VIVMTIRASSLLVSSSAALLLAMSYSSIAPAATSGLCKPVQVRFIASSLADSPTSSTSFINIPETTISFTQGGAAASCVLVRFSASTFGANGIDVIDVRAFLDNATAALPASIGVRGESDVTGYPRSFEFVFPSVAPGSHVLRMQFKSEKGNPVHVKAHNTVIQFAQ